MRIVEKAREQRSGATLVWATPGASLRDEKAGLSKIRREEMKGQGCPDRWTV